jgi:hypothetical protein
MNPLENYIRELYEIRSTGAAVKETSYYGPLANLFNQIGKTLKPKVRCIINLKNQGAGLPDGGFFTAKQFRKAVDTEPLDPQNPERGVLEVKPTNDDAFVVAESKQVSRYWKRYRQILVTNYHDFVLIGQDEKGKPIKLETYRLADNETEFWANAFNPSHFVLRHGERFIEYIKRVILYAAPITEPKDLAWFFASYARDCKARIDQHPALPALTNIRAALEKALGVEFKDQKGDHFFRSTLVQTLFYGIFSAWVLWHKENQGRADKFDWKTAAYYLHVPMIQALFEQISAPTKVKTLGLIEVLDWAGAVLNRVIREEFFARFEEGQAVQYFYEPFLAAFDPELRKEMGVWYTPPEIVKYMVARVDKVLRTDLNVKDGLANPNVHILDPCCGTGAYLVEVLKNIANTLQKKGENALDVDDVKEAAIKRVFGFEMLTAPFVVAHLQIGLLLQSMGVPLSDEKERVGVYLTNALTGWEPPTEEVKKQIQQLELSFPELNQEREAAQRVKSQKKILVILGNPPYNAFAGVSPKEEQGLVEPYKDGLTSKWGIRKFNLDDLYVRFFRLAERCIVERTGQGIVCFISNFSYLSEPSFLVMRQRFLNEFDKLWFDCLNGDSRETGKLTPEGKPDPSAFSTEYNREGIKKGTAVALMLRTGKQTKKTTVRFRNFWGVSKREDLIESLNRKNFDAAYELSKPDTSNRFSFRPFNIVTDYLEWPKIVALCGVHPFNGPVERRGNSLIAFETDKDKLHLLKKYFDPNISDSEMRAMVPSWMKSSGEFNAKTTRAKLKGRINYNSAKIVRYPFKPFDVRLAYLDSDIQPLFSRPSPDLLAMSDIPQNAFLITRDTADKSPEGTPFYYSKLVCDYDCISGHARHFPFYIRALKTKKNKNENNNNGELFEVEEIENIKPVANLSAATHSYLAHLGFRSIAVDAEIVSLIWMHILAIGYSPAYLIENADGLRYDWPRIPLPKSKQSLLASAELGKQVAVLLDTENDVDGVTVGGIRPDLKRFAVISRVDGKPLNPDFGDLNIEAGWGHLSDGGVIMPGAGKLGARAYSADERKAIAKCAKSLNMKAELAIEQLGKSTYDIYLNEVAYWKNMPENVWNYVIGGYQVIKKWLSYRESKLLGRAVTKDEVREATNIARRIAAILLLQPALDKNYRRIKGSTFDSFNE